MTLTTRVRHSIVCALFLALCTFANASVSIESIKMSAETCLKAFKDADYITFCNSTHPRIVKMAGGTDGMIALLNSSLQEMKSKGFVFQNVEVGEPEEPTEESGLMISTVPQNITLSSDEGTLFSESYLLAISENQGLDWTFIDIGSVDRKLFKEIFPELKNFQFPTKKKPVFTPKE